MTDRRWRLRLSPAALADYVDILEYTIATFGPRQAELYEETLTAALMALEFGPNVIGSTKRDTISPRLRSLHVARSGRRGRHMIGYRAVDETMIDVLRILHDSMDFAQHVPTEI